MRKWINTISKNITNMNSGKKLFAISLTILTIIAPFYVIYKKQQEVDESLQSKIAIAMSVQTSLSKKDLLQLDGNPDDKEKDEYLSIKNSLISLTRINQEISKSYIYKILDDKIIEIVNSDSATIQDITSTTEGKFDIYPDYKEIFQTARITITDPIKDRLGNWVSLLIPIKDMDTDDVTAVLGMDYSMTNWDKGINQSVFRSIAWLFFVYMIILSMYLLFSKNEKMKKARVQYEEGEKRISAITNSAHDGIIMMDYLGAISYWNPGATRIFGYTEQEALGKQLNTLIAPERYKTEYQKAFTFLHHTGRGGLIGKTIDLEALTIDKNEISIQLAISSIPMSIGWNSVCVIRDITRQKQIEADIIKAKVIAEEATKAKSDFLANMSHEIRTPMNAIIGFSSLLMKTEMSSRQRDYITKIDSSASSLLSVINDILDFSKIEAGKLEMESVDFRIDDVINNIIGMVGVKSSEKNIELLSTISRDVPYDLIGDSMRLGQVLINLTNNAIKFTEKGHILLRVDLISKTKEDCDIRFTVSDSGIGMTSEQISKLFSAFSQADSSVTRKYGGTGLGLTICKRLVEMMEGEISVESEYGVGSKFIFSAKFKISQTTKNVKTFDLEKFRSLKVLIVDDNDMACQILKEQISMFGMDVNTVDSGEKAITELEIMSNSNPYDLVFMDWQMPKMDGLEAAKRILENKHTKQVPMTIMVSAFGREEVFLKAQKIGVDAFLIKPINQSLLFDTIMEVFGINHKQTSIANVSDKKSIDTSIIIEGSKVLLVEDNLLNQEVASEILKMAGVIVDIANNGQEAIEKLTNKEPCFYDAILMDIQMPIMGGYEATKIIRSHSMFKTQPIIAMTAHAMQGVKEECIAAGMNDYVSKPIVPNNLYETLSKWVKPKVNSINSNANSICDSHDERMSVLYEPIIELPVEIDGIDIDEGLERVLGNRKLYRKLLDDFYKNHLNSANEIERLILENKISDAQNLAHMIKGVAGNISLYHIRDMAASIEKCLKNENLYQISELITNLKVELVGVSSAMESIYEKSRILSDQQISNSTKVIPIYSKEQLVTITDVFNKIYKQISKNMVSSHDSMEELKTVLNTKYFDEQICAISDKISEYEFDTATEILLKTSLEMGVIIEGDK